MHISLNTNTSFSAKPSVQKITRFRVPGKDGTTIVTDLIETGRKETLTNLKYQVMKKGKVLEEKAYHNKKGFTIERLATICEDIQQKVGEGVQFVTELINAQFVKH